MQAWGIALVKEGGERHGVRGKLSDWVSLRSHANWERKRSPRERSEVSAWGAQLGFGNGETETLKSWDQGEARSNRALVLSELRGKKLRQGNSRQPAGIRQGPAGPERGQARAETAQESASCGSENPGLDLKSKVK